MKEIPDGMRPYEKVFAAGPESLTDVELLAVLLRTGIKGMNVLELAKEILYNTDGEGLVGIHKFSLEQLKKIDGIGNVKAAQILCLSELSKRLAKSSAQDKLVFTNPSSIAAYFMEELRHENQEVMKLLMLNSKANLISQKNISRGTVNSTIVSPRELFVEALRKEAVGIIVLHNHPSGDPNPSEEDCLITARIKEAGALVGIDLLDHIIIGNNCYFSFREEDIL